MRITIELDGGTAPPTVTNDATTMAAMPAMAVASPATAAEDGGAAAIGGGDVLVARAAATLDAGGPSAALLAAVEQARSRGARTPDEAALLAPDGGEPGERIPEPIPQAVLDRMGSAEFGGAYREG